MTTAAPNVLIIAGPTASGKSARALRLAQEQKGVVINADSLQLYDALPILTAQPSQADQNAAPHRLYGVLDPAQSCDAVKWRDMALTEIRTAYQNGQRPIVVGGTGFYLKTLLEGLSPIPEIPDDLRLLGEDLMDRVGVDEFFRILSEEDPETAAKLDPKNRQRLIRAWEVKTHTGKSLAYWQALPRENPASDLTFETTIILPDRETLYDRCNQRFAAMLDQGALDEVHDMDERIMCGEVPLTAPITHALGFRPLQDHLRGEIDRATAIYLSQNETRHYAKRQVTWLRHQLGSEHSTPRIITSADE